MDFLLLSCKNVLNYYCGTQIIYGKPSTKYHREVEHRRLQMPDNTLFTLQTSAPREAFSVLMVALVLIWLVITDVSVLLVTREDLVKRTSTNVCLSRVWMDSVMTSLMDTRAAVIRDGVVSRQLQICIKLVRESSRDFEDVSQDPESFKSASFLGNYLGLNLSV